MAPPLGDKMLEAFIILFGIGMFVAGLGYGRFSQEEQIEELQLENEAYWNKFGPY